MRGPAIESLSPELRETRLRVVIDELRWSIDRLRREKRDLKARVERQAIKLAALRLERNQLEQQLKHAQRELSRRPQP